ncbi:unnamed protein product [Paramecium sonneborni]|uniref:Uncharacterized protein n=1 Tax=Paramecium sonneborni TaxID=65129 RepID=A0A8S1PVM7_9CILI|nr:unnamed protein product [Paramecium sonneborni]
MFQTQNFLNQYEIETQQSQPDNQLIQSTDDFEQVISSLSNLMMYIAYENQTQLNDEDSQNQSEMQVNRALSDLDSQKEYPNDFSFKTYHPSIFFEGPSYNLYKSTLLNGIDKEDHNEELIQEQSQNDDDIECQVYLNLTQIKALMKSQSTRKKQLNNQIFQQQQEQISIENQSNQKRFSISDLDIEQDEQITDDYSLNVEDKIQSYNSNFIILEKFSSQFKSKSQTKTS